MEHPRLYTHHDRRRRRAVTSDLAVAAAFERDLRAARYPALVASGKLGADAATVDFQAWHCIAQFIASGRFQAIDAGGADAATVVGWAHAEAAAAKALARVEASAAAAAPDKAPALHARAAALRAIHRRVQLRRQSIAAINRQLREQQRREAA
jgi:hypothetical protein